MKRSDDDEHDVRWTEEPPTSPDEERAAQHLRRVSSPAALTAAQIARIRARIDEAQPASMRWWAGWRGPTFALGATAMVAVAILALRGRPVDEAVAARRVSVPSCGQVTLADEAGRRIDLGGPAEASLVNARVVLLEEGRLAVRTGDEAVTIRVGRVGEIAVDPAKARAHVTVRPRSTAEVVVHPARTVIAAFAGSVAVEWRDAGHAVELAAGYSTMAEGTHDALPPTHTVGPDRLRSDGTLVAPAECVGAAATAPPLVAVAPAAISPTITAPLAAAPPSSATLTPAPRRRDALDRAEVPSPAHRPAIAPAAATENTSPPVAAPAIAAPAPTTTPAHEAAPESEAVTEQRLLATALRHLRDHDGAAALAALDVHHARFPDGVLAPESAVLRVDALLQLHRRAAAADHLDAMSLDGLPRARELHLVRGELAAELGRCERALHDFDAALTGRGDSLEERALFGRASCHARRGDFNDARADSTRYLERFPDGKFADRARRELQGR